jgi:hypothetical protein
MLFAELDIQVVNVATGEIIQPSPLTPHAPANPPAVPSELQQSCNDFEECFAEGDSQAVLRSVY